MEDKVIIISIITIIITSVVVYMFNRIMKGIDKIPHIISEQRLINEKILNILDKLQETQSQFDYKRTICNQRFDRIENKIDKK